MHAIKSIASPNLGSKIFQIYCLGISEIVSLKRADIKFKYSQNTCLNGRLHFQQARHSEKRILVVVEKLICLQQTSAQLQQYANLYILIVRR